MNSEHITMIRNHGHKLIEERIQFYGGDISSINSLEDIANMLIVVEEGDSHDGFNELKEAFSSGHAKHYHPALREYLNTLELQVKWINDMCVKLRDGDAQNLLRKGLQSAHSVVK
jgi:heme oxygenase